MDRPRLQHSGLRGLHEAEAGAEVLAGGEATPVVARADSVHERQPVAHPVQIEPRVEGGEPVPVDVPGNVQEPAFLAVEHHADVDELITVHTRHAAQDDVLVGHGRVHAAATRGSHWRVPRRALRKATYAARTSPGVWAPGTGSSHSSGTSATMSAKAASSSSPETSASAAGTPPRNCCSTWSLGSQAWLANRCGSVMPPLQAWWK